MKGASEQSVSPSALPPGAPVLPVFPALPKESSLGALIREQSLFRILFDHLPDYIYVKDLASRHVADNRANLSMLGARAETETAGKTAHDFFPKELADKYVEDDQRVFRTGEALFNREEPIQTRGGATRWLLTTKIPLRDSSGGIIGLLGISRDITREKTAQAAIQKLAAFPEHHPNPVMEFDENGRLAYFNKAALALAQELGQEHPAHILPSNLPELVRECLGSGSSLTHQHEVQTGRTFAWTLHPLRAEGVAHCYVMELTERLSLQAQLLQAQKMESIGQLAGGVAHDFNNILTVIQGHSGMLLKAELPPELQESAREISAGAQKAADMTRQLLMFSRQQLMRPRPVDLNETISAVVNMLQRLLGEHIKITTDLKADPAMIQADPGMIEQVLFNLGVNARDAMASGGELRLRTAVRNLPDPQSSRWPDLKAGEYIELSVGDTGVGIPPEHLQRIFEPFFTTKEVGKGTGLGLATVYGILKQHGAGIAVRSAPDEGAEFTLLFPVLRENAPAPSPKGTPSGHPQADGKAGGRTILVVEDEPALRALTKHLLQREGYRVILAESGVAALKAWPRHQESVDLLLTDLIMPEGMNGKQLAEQLQLLKPGLKVLFSSGYSADVLGSDFVLEEGINFLPKPYRPSELIQTIRVALETRP